MSLWAHLTFHAIVKCISTIYSTIATINCTNQWDIMQKSTITSSVRIIISQPYAILFFLTTDHKIYKIGFLYFFDLFITRSVIIYTIHIFLNLETEGRPKKWSFFSTKIKVVSSMLLFLNSKFTKSIYFPKNDPFFHPFQKIKLISSISLFLDSTFTGSISFIFSDKNTVLDRFPLSLNIFN